MMRLLERRAAARPPSVLLGRMPHTRQHQLPRRSAPTTTTAAAADDRAAAPAPAPPRALQAAARLAASRLAESRRGQDALFADPFAALLARADGERQQQQQQQQGPRGADATADEQQSTLDAIATRYLDECLLNATGATSVTRMAKGEDYRQVVLLGVDGGDCRPFRLPWPEGTIIFLVAPAEVHERAEALLSSSYSSDEEEGSPPARVPRGCLLRRVDLDTAALQRTGAGEADVEQQQQDDPAGPPSTIFMDALARAGFRGDRVSVWGLQGLRGLGLDPGLGAASRRAMGALLAEVSSSAAFHSLVAGELPGPLSKREGSNLLAEAGLLASLEPPGGAGTREYGRVEAVVAAEEEGEGGGGAESEEKEWPRLFFSAQQLRPSLEQMGIYSSHVEAMEGSDEDFGTLHFS
jgi:hypothetical protein